MMIHFALYGLYLVICWSNFCSAFSRKIDFQYHYFGIDEFKFYLKFNISELASKTYM